MLAWHSGLSAEYSSRVPRFAVGIRRRACPCSAREGDFLAGKPVARSAAALGHGRLHPGQATTSQAPLGRASITCPD